MYSSDTTRYSLLTIAWLVCKITVKTILLVIITNEMFNCTMCNEHYKYN